MTATPCRCRTQRRAVARCVLLSQALPTTCENRFGSVANPVLTRINISRREKRAGVAQTHQPCCGPCWTVPSGKRGRAATDVSERSMSSAPSSQSDIQNREPHFAASDCFCRTTLNVLPFDAAVCTGQRIAIGVLRHRLLDFQQA